MLLECGRCQAEYAQSDAFCRKCGAALTNISTSTGNSLVVQPAPQRVEGDVIEISNTKPSRKELLAKASWQTLTRVSAKTGEKLYQALQSETGKKITRGATTIALTLGTELATRAVKNIVAPEKNQKSTAPQAKSLTDHLLHAIQPTTNNPPPAPSPAQEEVVIIERFYRRRVYRRNQD